MRKEFKKGKNPAGEKPDEPDVHPARMNLNGKGIQKRENPCRGKT
jgi:hypothetical protein